MLDFQVFRAKVYRPTQASLFLQGLSNQDVLRRVIESRPQAELRRGHTWHVGNVAGIADQALYFALGRTTRATVPMFDEAKKEFMITEFDSAPYTHALIDIELELCAIARQTQLSPRTIGIARQLQNLLNRSELSAETSVSFEVAPVSDPEDFVVQLRAAYAVRRFSLTFTKPNPWDVNQDFQLPMERLLQEADGEHGQTAIKGPQLKPEVLETLARSAAATGNDASATLLQEEGSPPVRRYLSSDALTVTVETLETDDDKRNLWARLRGLYDRIRHLTGPGQ